MSDAAPIGGFFERHAPDDAGPSVLDAWTSGRPASAFVNARSAFAALAATRPAAAIWLPAFLCADLVSAPLADRIRLYPVLEGFQPDLAPVEVQARPGDIVLLAGAFGLPLAPAARDFAARRNDLLVVEDRAQALDAGPPVGWTLYSPRKLLGVADGGVLVSPDPATAPPQPSLTPDAEALWRGPDLRAADPFGRDNAAWHAANQAKEAAMAASPQAITDRTAGILARTSFESLVAPRRANWQRLDGRLRRWSALVDTPELIAPLGYVLRLPPSARAALLHDLHTRRIFAAVHWPRILGPAERFTRETAWTRELITLPCDHRYGADEMDRIADAVVESLA